MSLFTVGATRKAQQHHAGISRQVDERIDESIRAGERTTSEIAGRVLKDPVVTGYRVPAVLRSAAFLDPEETSMPSAFTRAHVESRVNALLAERCVAAVMQGSPAENDNGAALELAGEAISDHLPLNPRRRKRVINNMLLHFMLADLRGILDFEETALASVGPPNRVDPATVARWSLLVAEWPEMATAASRAAIADGSGGPISLESVALEVDIGYDNNRLKRFLSQEPHLDSAIAVLAMMTPPVTVVAD
jgi:hypothetical protein